MPLDLSVCSTSQLRQIHMRELKKQMNADISYMPAEDYQITAIF